MSTRRAIGPGGLLALALASLVLPDAAGACAVCYGDPDSAMAAGVNNAIVTLLVIVGVVLFF